MPDSEFPKSGRHVLKRLGFGRDRIFLELSRQCAISARIAESDDLARFVLEICIDSGQNID